jgi:TP901 family phage tail tape measure protein
MGQAAGATKGFASEVAGHGKAVRVDVERVGRAALVMAGGMALALGGAAKAAMDWETAWAGVTKTVNQGANETAEQFSAAMGQLESDLRGLATRLPSTHKEIAAVAEAAGQLGIERSAIAGFTETMVALGVSTDLTADQAATAIAQIENVMGTAQNQTDRFGATLVALGNAGASTESEILSMAQRVAGAGKLIGLSEADVLGLSNAMASMGIQAELGGGAMQRTLLKMYQAVKSGGGALDGFAKIAGVSAEEFARRFEGRPIDAVTAFVAGLNRIDSAGQDVTAALADIGIKGTQDLNVLLRLKGAGDLTAESVALASKAWKENTALQQEATKRYGTTESQLKMLRNQVNELAIDMGDTLLPAIKGTVDALGGFIGFLNDLPAPVKLGATVLLGLGTTAAGVIGIVGTMAPKVRELDKALESMGLGAGFASRNLGVIGKVAGRLFIIGTVVELMHALGDALDPPQHADKPLLVGSLIDMARRGPVAGEAAKRFGKNLDGLGDAIDRIANPSGGQRVMHFIDGLADKLHGGTTDLEDAKNQIDDLDKALADLAAQDPNMAAAALLAIRDAIGSARFNELMPLLDDYGVGVAAAANAEKLAAAGMDDMANSAGVSKKQIDALDKAIDELFDSLFGVEDAQDQWQQGLNDLDDTVKQAVEDGLKLANVLTDQSDGALELRGFLRDLVTDGAALVQQWVEQGIKGDELKGRIDALSQQFVDQARKLGIPQAAIDHYLEVIQSLPTEVAATVTANTAVAEWQIERMQILLSGISQGVTVPIVGRPYGFHPELYEHNTTPEPKKPAPNGKGSGLQGRNRRWGGVDYAFAGSGVTPAHIALGERIKYAEPETGGEAYIPRYGDHGRALGVLGVAAGWHKATVVPMGSMFHGSHRALSAASAPSGGGDTIINLNVNVAGSVHSKESLAREIEHTVAKGLRTNSGFRSTVQQHVGRN